MVGSAGRLMLPGYLALHSYCSRAGTELGLIIFTASKAGFQIQIQMKFVIFHFLRVKDNYDNE